MSECRVRGCDRQAVEVVDISVEGGPLIQTAACAEHALDLRAGGTYSVGDGSEIIMGDSLPLELVTYVISEDIAGQTIELHLGRGPEVQQIVTMRVSNDFVLGTPDDPWARAAVASWPRD